MKINKHRVFALLPVIFMVLTLVACSSGGDNSNAPSGSNSVNPSAPVVLDLSGGWKQANSNSETSYQIAMITENTIEVYWKNEEDNSTALYWAGTYVSPTSDTNEYSWDSINDKSKTDSALLASGDEKKTFTHKGGTISYSVSAMGMTTTVELNRSDEVNIQVQNTTSPPSSAPNTVSVSEKVILEQDDIVITLKSLSTDGWLGPELKVLIENNSEKSITIQTRNSAINGVMVDTMFSASIEPGKKSNDGITFSKSDLEQAGITTIKDIEFLFHVFDSGSWDTIFDSEVISISTSADAGFVQQYNDVGTLLYEDGGLKVVIQSKDDTESFWGADIYVYVENLTANDITIQLRDTSVNGFMIDPMFSCDVLAGKRAYDSITFLESHLTDNDISSIDEMEFSLHIFDPKSWNTIKDTEKLTVSFD